jgi:hypothetical protein
MELAAPRALILTAADRCSCAHQPEESGDAAATGGLTNLVTIASLGSFRGTRRGNGWRAPAGGIQR